MNATIDRGYAFVIVLVACFVMYVIYGAFNEYSTTMTCDIDLPGHTFIVAKERDVKKAEPYIYGMLKNYRYVYVNRDLVSKCEETFR